MKLSVITVCYNEKNIAQTCESIMSQTCQDFEWIVIDGGSADGTLDILNQYKSRINILVSEPDTGIYNAMNKGIRLARGEFLNFMNGGDKFASADCVAEFIAFPSAGTDIVYGNMNNVDKNGAKKLRTFCDNIDKVYFYYDCIGHQASFIRRELFEKYGLYKEDNKIVSDWEKWIVFAEHNCVFRHWDKAVADFSCGGISSVMTPAHKAERCRVISAHFSPEETHMAKLQAFSTIKIRLFHFLPFLSIAKKKNGHMLKVKLWDSIPLYKITNKRNIAKHYLFGFIPFLKVVEK